MRILHINSYYSSSKFYKNLFNEQRINGLDIEVYVPVPYGFNSEKFNFGSFTTVSETYNKYDRFIFHLKHNKINKDVQKRYEMSSFDIIHAHSLFSNGYIAWKLKKKYNVPYVVAIRNTDVNVFFKKMLHLRKTGIEILKDAKNIIFISESYKKQVLENYIPDELKQIILNKSIVIPNGIDDFWFSNKKNNSRVLDRKLIKLLYVGVIDKNKNITTTISAIEHLINTGEMIEFNIVGKIKDKGIYDLIKNKPFINYHGEKQKSELHEIYNANDLFIMPSINETFGLVYAEAMSTGLPVIYTRGQGFDGQFENGVVGFNVDPFNYKEIADKIIDLLDGYEERVINCLKLCHQFKWELINEKYMDIYAR